jgi:bifunctional non-homologous end joining protein LigD
VLDGEVVALVQFKRQQEFVIGGYKPEGASLSSIAAGYYEQGKLMFAGKVRGGFNPHSRAQLLRTMKPLATKVCPFANLPRAKPVIGAKG